MDEIGFMVKFITADGFIRFTPLGGWWDQVLLASHRVTIKTSKGDITGVIGAKPPHVLTQEERKVVVDKKDMYIDIGASCSRRLRLRAFALVIRLSPRASLASCQTARGI